MSDFSPSACASSPAPYRALIAWVSAHDGPPDKAISEAFAQSGYRLISIGPGKHMAQAADAAIVDFRHSGVHLKKARRLSMIARRSAPYNRLIYLCGTNASAEERAYLHRSGAVIPGEGRPAALIAVCRQIIRYRNICEEAGERLKSMHLLSTPHTNEPDKLKQKRILLCAKPSPLSLTVLTTLRHAGYEAEGALSASQAIAAIEAPKHKSVPGGPFAAAVVIPASSSDPLCGLVRRFNNRPAKRSNARNMHQR